MVHFRLLHRWNTQMNLNIAISKSMRPTRKCEFCGKTFVPRSGMQKYCSEECQAEAKRLRKKRQQDLINGIEPIMDLQHQEYLTFSKAAILMGCTRQYIYKLVANGKLKASRLSSRMAFVRKAAWTVYVQAVGSRTLSGRAYHSVQTSNIGGFSQELPNENRQ